MRVKLAVAALTLLIAVVASEAQSTSEEAPRVANGRVETHELSGTLAHEFQNLMEKAAEPVWVGYGVPQVNGDRLLCCGDYEVNRRGVRGECGNCRLEGRDDGTNVTSPSNGAGKTRLEGEARVLVLFRVAQKEIGKIRAVSEDCKLDAGGRTLIWLTGVKPVESIGWLEGFVKNGARWNLSSRPTSPWSCERTRHSGWAKLGAKQD